MTNSYYHYKKKRFYFVLLLIEVILIICINLAPSTIRAVQSSKEPKLRLIGDLPLEVLSYTEKVTPGSYAHLKLKATPNQKYKLIVEYYSGYSEAGGVGTRSADSNGIVEWHWKVGTNTYLGKFKATVHDSRHSGYIYLQTVNKIEATDDDSIIVILVNMAFVGLIAFTSAHFHDEKEILRDPRYDPPGKLSVLLYIVGTTAFIIFAFASIVHLILFLCNLAPDSLKTILSYILTGAACLLCAIPIIIAIAIIVLTILYAVNKRR